MALEATGKMVRCFCGEGGLIQMSFVFQGFLHYVIQCLGLSLDAWNQTQTYLCSLCFPMWPIYHQSNLYSALIWNNRVIQNDVIRWAPTADPSRSTPGEAQSICVLMGLFIFSLMSNQMAKMSSRISSACVLLCTKILKKKGVTV